MEQFGGQPWRLIVGMRNFAVHQYDDLDPRRVWRTATPFPMFRLVICEWMS
nr:HepT-like ribonuclease domain-containing protein [Naumannella cuiyingiana]